MVKTGWSVGSYGSAGSGGGVPPSPFGGRGEITIKQFGLFLLLSRRKLSLIVRLKLFNKPNV